MEYFEHGVCFLLCRKLDFRMYKIEQYAEECLGFFLLSSIDTDALLVKMFALNKTSLIKMVWRKFYFI